MIIFLYVYDKILNYYSVNCITLLVFLMLPVQGLIGSQRGRYNSEGNALFHHFAEADDQTRLSSHQEKLQIKLLSTSPTKVLGTS